MNQHVTYENLLEHIYTTELSMLVGNSLHSGSNAHATNEGDNFSCNLPTSQRLNGDEDNMSQGSGSAPMSLNANIENLMNLMKHLEEIESRYLDLFGPLNRDIDQTDEDGCTSLYKAASRGQLLKVTNLLESGADPNIANEDGRRSLHVAAEEGYGDIAKFLVDQGADVNAECDLGQTALHAVMHNDQCISAVASGMGHLNIVKYLIEEGSKIDKQDHRGYTPLHIAAANGHLEIVKYLTDQKCSVKEVDNAGLTPLSLAAKHGHFDTVKYLADWSVDEKAACSVAYRSGQRDIVEFFTDPMILRFAASLGDLESVQHLVQQGVDINSCDEKGWTLLDYAIQYNNCEVIDYLLTNGAKANQGKEESPLYMASRLGHLEAVNILISRGISVNAESHRGQIPLHAAATTGRIQVVQILIENGSDLNKTDIDGCTPLHAAVQNGHLEVVRYLIWKGAINIKYRRMTTLYIAAQSSHLDTVDFFLSKGADVNGENDTGRIPLHAAAANGSLKIVEKLINHGSDVNKMADNGWAPLDAAVYDGRLDVVRFLISHGATKTRFKGMTVLYIAAQLGHTDLIEYFATTGCDVNDGADSGENPILAACDSLEMLVPQGACIIQADRSKLIPLLAAAQGYLLVVTKLEENEADTKATDTDGMTPLQAAEVQDEWKKDIMTAHQAEEDFERCLSRFRAGVQDEMHKDTEKTYGMTPLQAAEDGGHQDVKQFLIRRGAEMQDKRHDTKKNLRSDRNCPEEFGSSWMHEISAYDRSGINGKPWDPMPLNVTDASMSLQNPWRTNPDGLSRPTRESYVSKPKTQFHGGEVPATDDLPITNENDALHPKPGIKSKRQCYEKGLSILTLLYRAILALVFFFACGPILVAGNLKLAEPVTLEVGASGVVTFYLQRPSSTLQFSLFYEIQFGSKGRPFCINGQYDVDGFKNPSQVSRFTTTVIDRDSSLCVNMTIDDVHTIDGDQYIFIGAWHTGENVLYDTQKKEVVVQRLPGPADCYITLSDSEFPYKVHCWANTGSMPTTLTCYQKDRDLVKVHNITDNGQTTRAIFFLPDTTHFSCCSHGITSTVGPANCNDFEWPPGYSGIPSTEATSRSMFAGEQSNWPTDPRPKTDTVGSGACSPCMIPSHLHFLYLPILVFVTMC